MLARARAAGATIGRPGAATFWGGYSGIFLDPDGHPWEVAHNPAWTLHEDGTVSLRRPERQAGRRPAGERAISRVRCGWSAYRPPRHAAAGGARRAWSRPTAARKRAMRANVFGPYPTPSVKRRRSWRSPSPSASASAGHRRPGRPGEPAGGGQHARVGRRRAEPPRERAGQREPIVAGPLARLAAGRPHSSSSVTRRSRSSSAGTPSAAAAAPGREPHAGDHRPGGPTVGCGRVSGPAMRRAARRATMTSTQPSGSTSTSLAVAHPPPHAAHDVGEVRRRGVLAVAHHTDYGAAAVAEREERRERGSGRCSTATATRSRCATRPTSPGTSAARASMSSAAQRRRSSRSP